MSIHASKKTQTDKYTHTYPLQQGVVRTLGCGDIDEVDGKSLLLGDLVVGSRRPFWAMTSDINNNCYWSARTGPRNTYLVLVCTHRQTSGQKKNKVKP